MGKIDEGTAFRMRFDERRSYRAIGDRFGTSRQAVAAFFGRRNRAGRIALSERMKRSDVIDVEAAKRLLEDDDMATVAERLEVSLGGLRRALKRG